MNYQIKSITFFALGLAFSLCPLQAGAATGQTVAYYEFTDEVSTIGWSAHDANEDGVTWGFTPYLNGLAYIGNTSANAANDWLFSPAIPLDGGTDYLLEYTVALRGCFAPETIEFYLGNQASPASMTQQLVSETYDFDAGKVTRYCHIHLDSPLPIIYVGLRNSAPAGNGIVSLKRLRVSTADPQQPEAVYSMAVVPNKAAGSLKVKWLNPERDINEAHISSPMTASVAINGTVVSSLDNCLAGEESSVVVTPEATSGKITVSVTTAIDPSKPARATEMLVDLDDEAGPRTLEANFTINTREEFAAWTVLNPDNNANQFKFDYGSAFLQGSGKCNDWLITPAVELTAGTRYLIRYKAKTSGSQYYADFKITVGNAPYAEKQTQTVGQQTKLLQNGFGEFTTAQFSVDADGTYYLGFNATYVGNSLDIKDVQVYSVAPGGEFEEPELSRPHYSDNRTDDLENGLEADALIPQGKRLSAQGVELYFACTAGLIDEYTPSPNGLFHIPYDGSYSVNVKTNDLGGMFGGGACYHDGKIYCNEYDYKSDFQAIHPVWKVFDAATFELLSEHALPDNGQATTTCLTYCTDNDRIYGFNRDYSDTRLMEIDPATGAMTDISGVLDPYKRFVALTATADGQLLCIYMYEDYTTGDQTHYLARIDRSNGRIVTIGQITGVNLLPEDILYNMKYRQAMFVNHSDGAIYWTFGSSSMAIGGEYTPTLRINPVSANATLCHYITGLQAISGAFFIEPRVGAPATVNNLRYDNAPNGANSGELSFIMPTSTYNGQPLEGDITYTVTEAAGKLSFAEATAAPGSKVTLPIEAANGMYNVTVTCANAAGTSAAISCEFLVGWDAPAAPANVTLEDEGLQITLTWEAPTAGIHGQPFDPETLRYIVLDYQNGNVLARGLTECSYTFTAESALRRHCYAVYSAIDDTPTAGALSNPAVVGDPIEPPFGGVFQSRDDLYDYYTIIDDNRDRSTWGYDSSTGSVLYYYSYYNEADDWLISPPFRLKAGEEYTLQFGAFSSNEDYLETMEVALLLGKTVGDVLYNLMAIDPVPALDEENNLTVYNIPVTVDSDGVYYYGFHVTSPAYYEYLVLYDIRFLDKAGVNDIAIDSAATATAVYDLQGRRLAAPVRGINLVRFSDGSVEKVIIP